jgi:Rrf2 family transcriptional regulator, cysteine metabolism repressor
MVSQKCQYAIRAVFELAKRFGQGPIKIKDIAETQAIPIRFLEVILNQLQRAGFVRSKRGADGGYALVTAPEQISVGDIVQFIEGPLAPVACMTDTSADGCSLQGNCVFIEIWDRAAKALSDVYDKTSFQDLIHKEIKLRADSPASFSI